MKLAAFICAHLIGDFLLQNHWMQRKSKNSWVCTVHVCMYSIPFCAGMEFGLLPVAPFILLLILIEHWLQDRFAFHLKWMRLYQHTTVDLWPTGPLCVDQSMHIAFIWILTSFI